MPNTYGASALDVVRSGANGKRYVSIDSLTDMLTDLARTLSGDAQKSVAILAETFFRLSSYATLDPVTDRDDGSKINARYCACGTAVLDAQRPDSSAIVVDVADTKDGAWFPIKVESGTTTVAPWTASLDGVDTVRLNEHKCAGGL